MKLAEYLDMLSWSQADLAREAKVSSQSVSRALSGRRISRRVAFNVVAALSKAIGRKLMLPEVEGLQVVPLKRRKVARSKKADATSKIDTAASSSEESGRLLRKGKEQQSGS